MTTKTFVTCKTCGLTFPQPGGHNCKGLQFTAAEIQRPDPLQKLASTLEEHMRNVVEEMDINGDQGDYYFDAGFTAGLRVALNEIAKLPESV